MALGIVQRWIQAFNMHDIDALLALYDDDARHYSPRLKASKPETLGWIKGKPALKGWWEDAFSRLPSLHYELEETATGANGTTVMIVYSRTVEGEPKSSMVEMFRLNGSGLIAESRVYLG